MLNNFLLKYKYINFFKNNLYLDYILKFFSKKIIYNAFIYLGFFFAEKFLIEYNTKYVYIYVTYKFLNFFKKLQLNNLYLNMFIYLLNIILFIL